MSNAIPSIRIKDKEAAQILGIGAVLCGVGRGSVPTFPSLAAMAGAAPIGFGMRSRAMPLMAAREMRLDKSLLLPYRQVGLDEWGDFVNPELPKSYKP